jgi:type IV pilus assembly protein PilB
MIYEEDLLLAKNLLALNIIDKFKHDKLIRILKDSQTRGCVDILVEEIGIDANVVQQSIATTFDIPEVKINEGNITVKESSISTSSSTKFKVIPVALTGMELTVAFVDPPYKQLVEQLKQESKHVIIPIVISLTNYRNLIKVPKTRAEEIKTITSKYNLESFDMQIIGKEKLLEAQRAGKLPPIDVLVDEIIIRAIKEGAHDLHFEPSENSIRIRIDKDGILSRLVSFPREFAENFGNVLKTKAGLNAFEKKKPQEGGYSATFGSQSVDLRVSTVPTIFGERIGVRIFVNLGTVKPLDDIGFSDRNLRKFLYLLNKPTGLIVVSGPSGSGKSTTIYAAVNELNTPDKNIMSVEDSIEFKLDFASQVHAGVDQGPDFANALKAILRQKPNIILVSEIRDADTGIVAAEAALAGNLVLSTMLSGDAIGTIPRLLNLGIPAHYLAPTLSGVIYQRLIRMICDNCRETYEPSKEELYRLGIMNNKGFLFHKGKGCSVCNGTGYLGRTAIHEIVVVDDMLKDLIDMNAPVIKLREAALHGGFKSIRYSAIRSVLSGVTTSSEILRVLG